jgi:hypothetical protein
MPTAASSAQHGTSLLLLNRALREKDVRGAESSDRISFSDGSGILGDRAMSGHEYTVEFRICSKTLDPAEITRELGLQPCQVRIEGTPGFSGRLQQGMWAYDGGEGTIYWESLAEGITFVLDKLWPYREAIAKYKSSGEFVWWCGNFQSSLNGGPRLSPDLLKRLGEFDADLFIENYFSNGEEEEQQEG